MSNFSSTIANAADLQAALAWGKDCLSKASNCDELDSCLTHASSITIIYAFTDDESNELSALLGDASIKYSALDCLL